MKPAAIRPQPPEDRIDTLVQRGLASLLRGDRGPAVDVDFESERVRRRRDADVFTQDVPAIANPESVPPVRVSLHGAASIPGDSNRRQPVALVVDDEPMIGSLIEGVLTGHGWRVLVARDAETALSEIEGVALDLLVTDYELPGISGLALASRILEEHPRIPILVVSGWSGAAGLIEGPRVAFMPKPFDLRELIARVEELAS